MIFSVCIMCTIADFSETSSCLSETGFYVNNTVNSLFGPSVRLSKTSDLSDNLVDASACLISTSNMTNVNIINIYKYSSL